MEGSQRPPTSLPLPPTTREDLQLDDSLEFTLAAKALHMCKQLRLLSDSNPTLLHISQRRKPLYRTVDASRYKSAYENLDSILSILGFVGCLSMT
ncbi:hypothetical protein TNCV_2251861 [Trichonephila clavipes]|nr:hypothetical protein TNCV_2251861 [Trichonephila clavipes]